MGSTEFGNFDKFCRDATLPVCNVLSNNFNQTGPWGGCQLTGISLGGGRILGNLGSILLSGIAIGAMMFLIFRSAQRKAAVGRLEMQLFLTGYLIISICEIFTIGEFPLSSAVRRGFTAVHIGFIIATSWILMLNAIVGYQVLDDGTPLSMGLMVSSAAILLVGTGYIVLDTGFGFTDTFASSYQLPNRNIALYVLYQLAPLVFIVAFFVLEAVLVLRILGEKAPMLYLGGAAIAFAAGQVFNYVVSPYICNGTSGKIDGSLFETLFTLIAVVLVWLFWASITEEEWQTPLTPSYP